MPETSRTNERMRFRFSISQQKYRIRLAVRRRAMDDGGKRRARQ